MTIKDYSPEITHHMSTKPRIPRLPHAFFRWYCKPDMYEELHGDLEEFFYETAEEKGLFTARLLYWWNVLRCFQPYAWKPLSGPSNAGVIMFRNYFKISLRSLFRNPLNSFINVFGLSVAIGIAVFVFAFANWTFSTDQFHEHKNEVFLVTFFANRDGSGRAADAQEYGLSPRPLGAMLKKDFSHISNTCRIEDRPVVIKFGDQVYHESLRFTDASFLEMFTFPLQTGERKALADPNSIILSHRMAEKYFGEDDPLGKELLVKFGEDNRKLFKVAGVAAPFPVSRTVTFNFLVNLDNIKAAEPGYDFHDWGQVMNATFVQVDDTTSIGSIMAAMDPYKAMQNQAVQPDWALTSFGFRPLATLHETSEYIRDDISWSSHNNYLSVVFLSLIAVFMLALACFNYINIAIVSATKRLKEIGVRKTIGATRRTVIVQFLAENVMLTFFALVIGIVLALSFFIPGFEQMWGFNMGFSFADSALWIYLPALLLVTSFLSGIYPALYISGFPVVSILKGVVRFGKKNPLTRFFLGFQLVLACIFITSAITFTQNSDWLANRSWGYEHDGVLYTALPDAQAFTRLRDALSDNADIVSIAGSEHHLGRTHASALLHLPDRQIEANEIAVDATYLETLGLQLRTGRFFRQNSESDKSAVVVNETLARNLQPGAPEEAVGQIFKLGDKQYEVIGVTADFHAYDFFNKVQPTFFRLAAEENYHFLSFRVGDGREKQAYETLQAQWAALFPETPFNGGYQNDVWGFYFEEIDIHAIVWQVVAALAIMLAGLGLYGLVGLDVTSRIRELSIRKVLGAGLGSIARTIGGRYVWLFGIGLLLGAPASYTLMNVLFDSAYTYHMPIGYGGVAIAVSVLALVLVLAVGAKVAGLRRFNPVKGLRVE